MGAIVLFDYKQFRTKDYSINNFKDPGLTMEEDEEFRKRFYSKNNIHHVSFQIDLPLRHSSPYLHPRFQ